MADQNPLSVVPPQNVNDMSVETLDSDEQGGGGGSPLTTSNNSNVSSGDNQRGNSIKTPEKEPKVVGGTCNTGGDGLCTKIVQLSDDDDNDDEEMELLFGPKESEYRWHNGRLRRFRPDIFVFEFFTQVFFPLSLPVVLLVQGKVAAQNKHMLPKATATGIRNFCMGLFMVLLGFLPLLLVFHTGLRWLYGITGLFFVFPLFRLLIIAGKYASFTTEYYRSLMTSPDHDAAESILLAVWYKYITDETRQALLTSACRYSGVPCGSLPDLRFAGGKTMKAQKYMKKAIDTSFGTQAPAGLIFVTNVIGYLIYPMIPIMTYYDHWKFELPPTESYERQVYSVLITCLLVLQGLLYAPAITGFMCAGLLHYMRKYELFSILTENAIKSHSNQVLDKFMIPLSNCSNVHTWMRLRIMARYFGRVYEHRVAWNTFAGVLTLVAAFLQMIVAVFFASSDAADDPVLKIFTLFSFVVFAAYIFGTLIYAVFINQLEIQALETISHEEFLLLSRAKKNDDYGWDPKDFPEGSAQGEHQRSQLMNHLRAARSLLKDRQEMDPMEFAHVPATPSLLSAFFGLVVSVISFNVVTFYATF